MKEMVKAIPVAFKVIIRDPINLFLAIIPTLIALALYLFTIITVYQNSDRFVSMFRDYIYTAEQANVLAKVLTAVLIIFIFVLMSWTFVIVVGIIAAPFNSMLSSRIEKSLVQHISSGTRQETIQKMNQSLVQTFKNELKKIVFILIVTGLGFLLNMFPLFYPIGILLVSLMLAVQFIDYSWSRHDMHFGSCLKDLLKNFLVYAIPGFVFLLLVTIPLINALIPALATSYFTILWLYRQKQIQ
jgi:CysZ protein